MQAQRRLPLNTASLQPYDLQPVAPGCLLAGATGAALPQLSSCGGFLLFPEAMPSLRTSALGSGLVCRNCLTARCWLRCLKIHACGAAGWRWDSGHGRKNSWVGSRSLLGFTWRMSWRKVGRFWFSHLLVYSLGVSICFSNCVITSAWFILWWSQNLFSFVINTTFMI